MKLSALEGEEAISVFADLLEPVSLILADDKIVRAIDGDVPKFAVVRMVLKGHPKEVQEIAAVLEGEDPSTYKVNFATLPKLLLSLFQDKDLIYLFTSQGQNSGNEDSGSAMVNTEGADV